MSEAKSSPSFFASLISGGCAGMAVDISLYPLDTLKTRLQSSQGFIKSGGFKGVYAGLGVAALGSAPGAALFFSSYEGTKAFLPRIFPSVDSSSPVVHMTAASISEVIACLVRVPTEVVKQRYQAKVIDSNAGLFRSIGKIHANEGISGFYKGFGPTIMREIPFSLIQFPLYEYMKVFLKDKLLKREPYSFEYAVCGSISGGIAAGLTTPLDVVKTRIMLGKDKQGVLYEGFIDTIKKLKIEAEELAVQSNISKNKALRRVFFAGVEPRVMWISIGGFVFFGAYEQALSITRRIF